jgi:hypothetical protein
MDELLNYVYYDLHNYVGATSLYKIVKEYNKNIKLDEVKDWLKKQEVHQITTQKDIGIKKINKPIYSDSHYSFQIDLTFLPQFKSKNEGNYVLFTAINTNSRYAYVYWSKNKNSESIIKMLNEFKKNAMEIDTITSDSGTEFTNKDSTKWFLDNDIKTFFYVGDSNKLGIINRFHRTLKQKIDKYMLAHNSARWIDVINKIVYNYNRTVNTGIGFTPLEASKSIVQSTIINDAIDKTKLIEQNEDKIEIGEKCRILLKKKTFDKGETKYSKEIYEVVKIHKNTLSLINEEGDIKKISRDKVAFINEVQRKVNDNKIKEVVKENKVNRIIKHKEGLDESNIINRKRH